VAWKIPREFRPALIPILRTIAELTERIRKFEHHIERIAAARYPETKRLRQVDGVGVVTALTFVLTLEDPSRFHDSRVVGAFLGICPKRNQSGKSDPEMHISKAGDPELRRLLVQGAQYILRPFGSDCDLRRFGLAMAMRGNKAATATRVGNGLRAIPHPNVKETNPQPQKLAAGTATPTNEQG
jgi:transposase